MWYNRPSNYIVAEYKGGSKHADKEAWQNAVDNGSGVDSNGPDSYIRIEYGGRTKHGDAVSEWSATTESVGVEWVG